MTDQRAADLADTRAADAFDGRSSARAALEPGEQYAARYQIVELLGRGGMGEVYRVHDTVLGVTVALKRVIGGTPADRAQIIREVRLARQITHRAVCRVFDVGESAGDYYYTMEYVQGEDLGALLRRIGRLPADKVIDIAQQACAGLTAAHERGILHRDLKPANIMIDGRGDVRITDFGIAAQGPDAPLAGTPAYMAPEQLRGLPASPQSDLYALGLVLYEILVGARPFADDRSRDHAPPPPSAAVPGVDARFERVLLRALEPDPAARPESAAAFSAELPGGNLLKATLAAGETPSPNLVAAAASAAPLDTTRGTVLLALCAVGLAVTVLTARTRLVDRAALTDPPAALAATARSIAAQITGGPTAAHSTYRLMGNAEYVRLLAAKRDLEVDERRLAELLYRESPQPIVPLLDVTAAVPFEMTADNPPLADAGATAVVLDGSGRLLRFRSIPNGLETAPAGPVDWMPFVRASGIDPASLASIVPRRQGGRVAEQQRAWRGRLLATSRAVTIDAAEADGRPVWFDVAPLEAPAAARPVNSRLAAMLGVLFSAACLLLTAVLASRNVSAGRADLRGARWLAQVLMACQIASWLLGATFLPVELEFQRFMIVAAIVLLGTVITVSFYLAFEPIVRRRWPWSLIAWNRLLARGMGDPLVGRDVLVGAAVSIAGTALYQLLVLAGWGLRGDRPATIAFPVFMGARHQASALLAVVPDALTSSMLLVLLYSVLVMVLRRGWAAGAVLTAAFVIPTAINLEATPLEIVLLVIAFGLLVTVFCRVGLVALASYTFFDITLARFPLALTDDWRSEAAVMTLAVAAIVLAAAGYTSMRQKGGSFAVEPARHAV